MATSSLELSLHLPAKPSTRRTKRRTARWRTSQSHCARGSSSRRTEDIVGCTWAPCWQVGHHRREDCGIGPLETGGWHISNGLELSSCAAWPASPLRLSTELSTGSEDDGMCWSVLGCAGICWEDIPRNISYEIMGHEAWKHRSGILRAHIKWSCWTTDSYKGRNLLRKTIWWEMHTRSRKYKLHSHHVDSPEFSMFLDHGKHSKLSFSLPVKLVLQMFYRQGEHSKTILPSFYGSTVTFAYTLTAQVGSWNSFQFLNSKALSWRPAGSSPQLLQQ